MDPYTVLLGVDSSKPRARAQANAVADLPAASESVQATVVYVFSEPHTLEATQISSVRLAAARLEEAGIETTTTTRVGDPSAELIQLAATVDANVICLGEWDRSSTTEMLHGSVTREVTHRAERPVLLCYADPDGS